MHLGYSYIVLTIRTYFIAETIASTYFEDYVSYMNSTTTINTLPKSEVPTIELCHKEKSIITSCGAYGAKREIHTHQASEETQFTHTLVWCGTLPPEFFPNST